MPAHGDHGRIDAAPWSDQHAAIGRPTPLEQSLEQPRWQLAGSHVLRATAGGLTVSGSVSRSLRSFWNDGFVNDARPAERAAWPSVGRPSPA